MRSTEFTTEELGVIVCGLESLTGTEVEELHEELNAELEERLEMESMDFNDCAGGACKL